MDMYEWTQIASLLGVMEIEKERDTGQDIRFS